MDQGSRIGRAPMGALRTRISGWRDGARSTAFALCALACAAAFPVHAVPYYYVNWTSANVAQGSAVGTITLPDASTVTVTFQATAAGGGPGTLFGAQTSGGTNYWIPSAPYISTQVDNAPPDSDILQLAGGQNQTYTVTLSPAIRDPIMAIVSLGAPGTNIDYVFNAPFTIVSQGAGYWGNGPLTQLPGNVLRGQEGHGTIQFLGTFSTFSWTVPTTEIWHGFTFGIRTTTIIEPNPTITIGDLTAVEGNAGTTAFSFPVTLSAASTAPVTVNYATANGTATAGSDYAAASGTLTFAPGVISQTIMVNVTGDTAVEADETFDVNLSNPTNATIARGSGRGTIRNDDSGPPPPPQDIPTVSEWVLLLMSLALGGVALARLRRRT